MIFQKFTTLKEAYKVAKRPHSFRNPFLKSDIQRMRKIVQKGKMELLDTLDTPWQPFNTTIVTSSNARIWRSQRKSRRKMHLKIFMLLSMGIIVPQGRLVDASVLTEMEKPGEKGGNY